MSVIVVGTDPRFKNVNEPMPYPIVVTSRHFPPSTNTMFRNVNGKGRVKTERYRTWTSAAGWDANGKGTCSGPFKLIVAYSTEHRRSNMDLDNRLKAVLDLLVTHGIVDDDSKCEAIHASWQVIPDGKAFRAEIWPVRA